MLAIPVPGMRRRWTGDPRESTRPRERLRARGADALSAAELIALLLRTGARGRDAVDVARALLAHAGGLDRLESAPACELAAVPGVGAAKAASLIAAFELGRRCAGSHLPEGAALRSPQDVFRHFGPRLRRLGSRALRRRVPGRATSRARRGDGVAGHADREPRPPARGVPPGAARERRGADPGPQPPERRSDAERGGPRGHGAAGPRGRDPRRAVFWITSWWRSAAT